MGGQKVGQGLHPWQVAIYFDGELRCGGSLFSERYILTAAHCFYGALDQLQLIKIVLGEHDREKFEGIVIFLGLILCINLRNKVLFLFGFPFLKGLTV